MKLTVLILAAGQGKRMCTHTPKVLHKIAGMSLLERVIQTAEKLSPETICVVYGNQGERVKEQLSHASVTWVEQKEQLGTGHAVMQAVPHIPEDHQVLILYGDVPLISKESLKDLLEATPTNGVGMITCELDDPNQLGRILRDHSGNFKGIVEYKDASSKEKKIKEVNSGIYSIPARRLKTWLPLLQNNNSQKEYYLTDVLEMAVSEGVSVATVLPIEIQEVLGVNDLWQLSRLERYYQVKQAQRLMLKGVRIMDPARIDIRGNVVVGKDVLLDVNVLIEGNVTFGNGTQVGANTVIKNSVIGKGVVIHENCVIENAVIGDECMVGPFARLRPETKLAERAKVGNFVEIKNASLGKNSKVNHITYIGDATIGEHTNVGAGTVTCNYDGVSKHPTQIGSHAFIGSGTQLVAPIKVGDGAYIGAGSTITKDAPEHKLTVSRARQTCIESWQPPQRKKEKV